MFTVIATERRVTKQLSVPPEDPLQWRYITQSKPFLCLFVEKRLRAVSVAFLAESVCRSA